MTSEKDYNKDKTEKQLSQLKDRLDKEGVGTHGTSARLLPVLPRLAVPVLASQLRGFEHLLLQLDLHQIMFNAPWATVHVCGTSGKLKSQQTGTPHINAWTKRNSRY